MAELEAFGITTANMAASLRFYGLLGVETTDAAEEHVESRAPSRVRLMWDTEDLIRQIEPDLPSPVRQRVVLAFRCGFAYMRDPDGNTVALLHPRVSRSRGAEQGRGSVAADAGRYCGATSV